MSAYDEVNPHARMPQSSCDTYAVAYAGQQLAGTDVNTPAAAGRAAAAGMNPATVQSIEALPEVAMVLKAANGDFEHEARRIEAERFGGAMASKLLSISASVPVSELEAGKAIQFDREDLKSVLQVHPRNQTATGVRVGDFDNVVVTHVLLKRSFNNHTLPINVSSPQFPGKAYPLTKGTGRPQGRNNRILMTLDPGAHHYGATNIVFRRTKTDMLTTSSQQIDFDLDKVKAEIVAINDKAYGMPTHNLVARMIQANHNAWGLQPKDAQVIHEYNTMVIPRPMKDMILDMLEGLQCGANKQRTDLSVLSFTVQSAANQTDAEKSFSGGDKAMVFVSFDLYVKYVFLNKDALSV